MNGMGAKGRWWHGWLLAFMVAVVLPTFVQRPDRTDLHLLAVAADRLWNGQAVYRLDDVNEHTKPPLATLVFLPLSFIPLFWLSRLWDLLNGASFVCLIRLLVRQVEWPVAVSPRSVALAATFLCLTPLNAELRLGQYNILLLACLAYCGFRRCSGLSGVALCFAVLFKPTFIFLAPWSLRCARRPGVALVAGAVTLAGISGLYAAVFGLSAFLSDMQNWLEFLPKSSAKHLLRWDNHGLPSVVASATGWNPEKAFLVLGLGLSSLAVFRCSDRLLSLAVTCALMVVFSPMAWMQNYSLLLPAGVWAADTWLRASGLEKKLTAVSVGVLWLGIGALNPTTCQWSGCEQWSVQRLPLWALLAASVLAVSAYAAGRRLERIDQ